MKPLAPLALAAALLSTAVPARADEAARWSLAYAAVAAVDTAQTCTFAPPGSPYDMREQSAAWAIGPHPSCASAAAYILGGSVLVSLLPHNKAGVAARKVFVLVDVANVASNFRVMAAYRL